MNFCYLFTLILLFTSLQSKNILNQVPTKPIDIQTTYPSVIKTDKISTAFLTSG